MKTRQGFVSNSSSSSFLIYGVCLDGMKYDDVEDKISGSILEIHNPPYDSIYVGRSWDSIGDDETGRQFKQSVIDILYKLDFNVKSSDIGTIERAWYDG